MSGEAPIEIASYDPRWPKLFEDERARLSDTIGDFVFGSIEHIGSTAVPGLAAKPVIDIMVGVRTLEASRPALPVLEEQGYCYFPYRAEVMHWLCKPSPKYRTHHLHLVRFRSRLWFERIAFRDYLRRHPEVAADYAELKHGLAKRYRTDRGAYTDAKEPFIRRVIELALLVEMD